MEVAQVVGGVVLAFVIAIFYVLQSLLRVCEPSEVLIISGTSQGLGERTIGYQWIKGGRAVVYPMVEKLHRMDLRSLTIDLVVKGAYSKGGIPLNIEGVANVKICGDQPLLHHAVERFLGTPLEHIVQIAKETLEGNLRGVLARLTPEQVNHDKMEFAKCLVEEADKDLHKLGLTLDTLKIQNIHDDVGYLDCIGRKKRAEQQMTNRVAEANSRTTAALVEADNRQKRSMVEIENKMKILRAEAETKIVDAKTRRGALIAEEESKVNKQIAKAEADIAVWQAQIEQVKHRLQADIVQPADAQRRKTVSEAQAKVAPIRESGRATSEMLAYVVSSWKKAGPRAREVFVMQKLDGFIDSILRTIPHAVIDRLTVVSGGGSDGGSAPLLMQLTALVDQFRTPPPAPVPAAAPRQGALPAAATVAPRPALPAPQPAPSPAQASAQPAARSNLVEEAEALTLTMLEEPTGRVEQTLKMDSRQPQRQGPGGRRR